MSTLKLSRTLKDSLDICTVYLFTHFEEISQRHKVVRTSEFHQIGGSSNNLDYENSLNQKGEIERSKENPPEVDKDADVSSPAGNKQDRFRSSAGQFPTNSHPGQNNTAMFNLQQHPQQSKKRLVKKLPGMRTLVSKRSRNDYTSDSHSSAEATVRIAQTHNTDLSHISHQQTQHGGFNSQNLTFVNNEITPLATHLTPPLQPHITMITPSEHILGLQPDLKTNNNNMSSPHQSGECEYLSFDCHRYQKIIC